MFPAPNIFIRSANRNIKRSIRFNYITGTTHKFNLFYNLFRSAKVRLKKNFVTAFVNFLKNLFHLNQGF